MGAEIDRLEIQVETQASKANRQLDELISKLGRLAGSLSSINSGGMKQFAVGMKDIASASKNMSEVKAADMNRAISNLQKLAGIKTGNMFNVGNALLSVTKGIQGFSGVSATNIPATVSALLSLSKLGNKGIKNVASVMPVLAKNLQGLATAINGININPDIGAQLSAISSALRTFGHKSMKTAIDNMPALSKELMGLMQTLSTAPKVSANLINLVNALARLSAAGSSVRAAVNGVQSVGQKSISTSGGLQQLSNSLSRFAFNTHKAQKSTRSFSTSISSLYANCFLLIRGFKAIGRAVESSMDYIETYNYYNVTMSKIANEFSEQWQRYGYESAEAYGDSFTTRLNELTRKMSGYTVGNNGILSISGGQNLSLDPEQLMNYQSNVAAITNSVGLVGETSVNTAKALSMLAADMSSLKNIDMSTVMTNFQSGLIGQSRALYKYGIDITNATLQTYAYKYGLETAVSEMTQADKMQLRLLAILEQSKVAWGDMGNTIGSVANQYRILKQQVANLARIIGNLLIPIVAKALPIINGVVIALQRMFTFIGNLLGVDWSGLMDGISTGYGGADDAIGDLVDDTDNVVDGTDGIGDSLDSATEKAKKLRQTLLGFDEINMLTDNSDVSGSSGSSPDNKGGSGAGGIDLSDAIAAALADYESIWNKALENSQNKAQEYADNICKAFEKIWKTAEPTRKAVSKLWDEGLAKLGNFSEGTLYDFWDNFLKPVGTWMLADNAGLPRFFNITNDLLNEINWGKLKSSLSDFYKSLQSLAKFGWNGLMDFYEGFMKPMSVWAMSSAVPQLVDTMTAFIDKVDWERILASLRNFWDALAPFAKNVGQGLIDFLGKLLDIGADFLNNVLPGGLNGLADALNRISPEQARDIGEALGKIAVALLAFGALATVVKGIADFGLAIKGIAEGFGALFGSGGVFAKGFSVISSMFSADGIFGSGGLIYSALMGIQKVFFALTGITAPIGVVIGAVVAFAAAVIDLWKTSETFRDAVGAAFTMIKDSLVNAFNKISEAVSPLWESIKNLGKTLYEFYESSGIKKIVEIFASLLAVVGGGVISTAIDTIANTLSGLAQVITGVLDIVAGIVEVLTGLFSFDGEKIKEGFTKIGSGMVEAFSGALNFFTALPQAIFDKIILAKDKIVEWASGLWETATTGAQRVVDGVVNFFEGLPGKIGYAIGFAIGELASWAKQLYDTAAEEVPKIINMVYEFFKELPGKIWNAIVSAKDKIGEWCKNLYNKVKEEVPKITKKVIEFFAELPGKILNIGKNIVSGFIDGIQGKWESAKKKVGDFVDGIVKGFREGFDVHSPSRVMQGIGENVAAGLENGIDGSSSNVLRVMDKLGDNLKNSINQSLGDMEVRTARMMQNLKNEFSRIVDEADISAGNIVGAFSGLHIPIPHLSVSWDNWNLGSLSFSVPNFDIDWYAKGGFPEMGELFIARESGPEMVGSMSGRPAVANNDQIVEGISNAVYPAVKQAVAEAIIMTSSTASGNEQAPIIEVTIQEDCETTYKRVLKGEKKYKGRYEAIIAI